MTWNVGDKAVRFYMGEPVGPVAVVAKVYKNGNVVFEGSKQQYRQRGDTLHSTSGSAWDGEHYGRATDETLAELRRNIAIARRKTRARKCAEWMQRNPTKVPDAAMEIIEAAMRADKEVSA